MGKHINKWLNDLLGELTSIDVEKFGQKLIFYQNKNGEILLQYSIDSNSLWVHREKIWDILLQMVIDGKLVEKNIKSWVKDCYNLKPYRVEFSYGSDLEWWKNQI
jgi:hypothetical protein